MTIDDASSGAPWQPLVQIGDISVDQQWVRTPSGSVPTAQVSWTVQEQTRLERVIPTYAIVLAVVVSLMTCFLGLLFLLVKEERTTRWLLVTVHGPAFAHSTYLPASFPEAASDVYARVDYARSLTASARQ
jgi:hypothetical protein